MVKQQTVAVKAIVRHKYDEMTMMNIYIWYGCYDNKTLMHTIHQSLSSVITHYNIVCIIVG